MPQYQVLITLNQYRVVMDANSADEARELALQEYMDGNIELDSMPEFVCEEADRLEEEEV